MEKGIKERAKKIITGRGEKNPKLGFVKQCSTKIVVQKNCRTNMDMRKSSKIIEDTMRREHTQEIVGLKGALACSRVFLECSN